MEMIRILLAGALLAGACSAAAAEGWDAEVRFTPVQGELGAVLQELDKRIRGPDVVPASGRELHSENIPSLDRWIADTRKQLLEGSSPDREQLLGSVESAREALRRGYNKMSAAQARLARTRDEFLEIESKSSALAARNRDFTLQLKSVANSAQATAGAMTVSPPGSNGSQVPLQLLCSITALQPEIKLLQDKLRSSAKGLQEAGRSIEEARKAADSESKKMEDDARRIYSAIMARINERRTSKQPTRYYSKAQAPEVILNARLALAASIEKSDGVLREMQDQLRPENEGLGKALEKLSAADVRTHSGKILEEKHGSRVNFNHFVRLRSPKGVILRGWEAADEDLRSWWIGRAGMARSEAQADAAAMVDAYQDAHDGDGEAQRHLQACAAKIADLDRELGASKGAPREIARQAASARPRVRASSGGSSEPAVESRPIDGSTVLRINREGIAAFEERMQNVFDGARR